MTRWLLVPVFLMSASCKTAFKAESFQPDSGLRKPANHPNQLWCLREICGSESKNLTYTDADEIQSRRYMYLPGQPFYKRMDRLIRDSLAKDFKDVRVSIDNLRWTLTQNSPKLTAKVALLLNALDFYHIWYDRYQKWYKTNPKATRAQIYALKFTNPDFADAKYDLETVKWFLKVQDLNFIDRRSLESLPLKVYLRTHYPTDSFATGVQKALKKCAEEQKVFLEAFGAPGASDLFGTDCTRILTSKEPIDETSLSDALSNVSFFSHVLQKKFSQVLGERQIDLHRRVSEYLTSQEFARLEAFSNKNPDDLPEYRKVLEYCHKNIGGTWEVAGSDLVYRKWQDLIELIKIETIRLVAFKNEKLTRQFHKAVDDVEFSFPLLRSNLEATLIRRFEEDIAAFQRTTETRSNPTLRTNLSLFGLMMKNDKFDNDGNKEDTFDSTKEICKAYASRTLSDHIYTAHGASYLSWLTLKFPEYGIGIIAHEMGHYVSRILSNMGSEAKGKFYLGLSEEVPVWEQRRCVNDLHVASIKVEAEGIKTEEDWADYFGAKISKSLLNGRDWIKNFGCALNEEQDASYVTSQQDTDDSHSNDFFRTILIEKAMRGRLPSVCAVPEAKKLCD